MSHVVGVNVIVKDLEALKRAVEALGLEFMEGQTTHKWYGRWVGDYNSSNAAFNLGIKPEDYGKCLHAIRMKDNPGAYEIGVVKRAGEDGYNLVFDFYAQYNNITRICGEDLRGLLKEYEYQIAVDDPGVKDLINQGYHIERDVQENGDILVKITNE